MLATLPATSDDAAANDFYWANITPADAAYLLAPRTTRPPCPWCQRRIECSEACREMQHEWKINTPFPFGRYRTKPIGDVPHDYLRWAPRRGTLSAEVREAVQAVLATPPESRAGPSQE